MGLLLVLKLKSLSVIQTHTKNINDNDFSFAVNAYNWYYSSRGNFLLLFCNEKLKIKNN